jgi:succinate dehydrogenase hydrophobic anchor subunit
MSTSAADSTDPDGADQAAASWGWHLMQVSAWLLAVMLPIHLASTWLVRDVGRYGVALYVDRWQTTPWRIFDWAFIVLALAHGGIGLYGLTGSRIDSIRGRTGLAVVIGVSFVALGLAVSSSIFSFDVIG